MPSQHFKAVIEFAHKMTSGHIHPETLSGPTHDPSNSPKSSYNRFENQLEHGLYVRLDHLNKNKVGWTYRNLPIMIYGKVNSKNLIHLTSSCPHLDNTENWVWVSSNRNKQNKDHHWCPQCLTILEKLLVSQCNSQTLLIDTVQHFSYEYFHVSKVSSWVPGSPIQSLHNKKVEKPDSINNSDDEPLASECHRCSWKLPISSKYMLSGYDLSSCSNTVESPYCLFCAQDTISERTLIIPEQLRWQGLQKRFQYFDGICENWAQLRFHIDKSWHPLVYKLQQYSITLPTPYQVINDSHHNPIVAPLAWVEQKKAILPDNCEETPKLKKGWEILTYSSLLESVSE